MDGGRVEKRWRAISGEEGRGEEEEGSGVARQLRTSESKFHKKTFAGPAARATRHRCVTSAPAALPPPDLFFNHT